MKTNSFIQELQNATNKMHPLVKLTERSYAYSASLIIVMRSVFK